MPELPEVETIRNDLAKEVVSLVIKDIGVREKIVVKSGVKSFKKSLLKNKITGINRVGKLLIFVLEKNNVYLLIHLKMTGQLVYQKGKRLLAGGHSVSPGRSATQAISVRDMIGGELPNKYTHVIFTLSDGSKLYFNDLRRFGYLKVVTDQEKLSKIIRGYGLEPLTGSWQLSEFKKVLKTRKTNIKAVLLNQKIISGIGNIYADEILFAAGVRPTRIAKEIKPEEATKIFKASEAILKKAIKYRGTTFSDFVDIKGGKGGFGRFLRVYQKQGQKCPICGNLIKKIKVAGRGTHYCPNCQN